MYVPVISIIYGNLRISLSVFYIIRVSASVQHPMSLLDSLADPSAWKSYTMKKNFRGKILNVTVNNPNGSEHGVKKVTVNGTAIDGLLIRDDILKPENEIIIEM